MAYLPFASHCQGAGLENANAALPPGAALHFQGVVLTSLAAVLVRLCVSTAPLGRAFVVASAVATALALAKRCFWISISWKPNQPVARPSSNAFKGRSSSPFLDLFVDLRVGEPDHAFRDRTVSAIEKMWD